MTKKISQRKILVRRWHWHGWRQGERQVAADGSDALEVPWGTQDTDEALSLSPGLLLIYSKSSSSCWSSSSSFILFFCLLIEFLMVLSFFRLQFCHFRCTLKLNGPTCKSYCVMEGGKWEKSIVVTFLMAQSCACFVYESSTVLPPLHYFCLWLLV